jgi:hypothetical protein
MAPLTRHRPNPLKIPITIKTLLIKDTAPKSIEPPDLNAILGKTQNNNKLNPTLI